MSLITRILGKGSFWSINKDIAKAIGIMETVMLMEHIGLWEKFQDENGEYYRERKLTALNTGVQESKQQRIENKLIRLNLISKEQRGQTRRNYYKIHKKNVGKLIKNPSKFSSVKYDVSKVKYDDTLIREITNDKVKDKSLTDKSNKKGSSKFPILVKKSKTLSKHKKKEKKIVKEKYNTVAQQLMNIWIDQGGNDYTARAIKAPNTLNNYARSLFSRSLNAYASLIDKGSSDKEFRNNYWQLEEFENAVKRYFASSNEKMDIVTFIYQKAFNGKMKARSRLLECHKAEQNKYEFRGVYGKVSQFIFKFYKKQIGNPEEVNPGVFVNMAKNIAELEKSFVINPSLMFPESQFWYKYMQYIKREFDTNSNFIPAYMSSKNFTEKFKINAQKNGALLKRS